MRRRTKALLAGMGTMLAIVGFYLLPFGTDIFLYFFVEHVAHGDWFWGAVYANAAAIGMIAIGFLLVYVAGKRRKKGGRSYGKNKKR